MTKNPLTEVINKKIDVVYDRKIAEVRKELDKAYEKSNALRRQIQGFLAKKALEWIRDNNAVVRDYHTICRDEEALKEMIKIEFATGWRESVDDEATERLETEILRLEAECNEKKTLAAATLYILKRTDDPAEAMRRVEEIVNKIVSETV